MTHKYDKIIRHFVDAFTEMRAVGLADVVAKGGVGEILLAGCLGHELHASDKGADGISPEGQGERRRGPSARAPASRPHRDS